jgi:hypothetical protein
MSTRPRHATLLCTSASSLCHLGCSRTRRRIGASPISTHLRCETLVKVQCQQTVKLIPSSYQSVANPASPRCLFASVQCAWERIWTCSHESHEIPLWSRCLASSGPPVADNRRHGGVSTSFAQIAASDWSVVLRIAPITLGLLITILMVTISTMINLREKCEGLTVVCLTTGPSKKPTNSTLTGVTSTRSRSGPRTASILKK